MSGSEGSAKGAMYKMCTYTALFPCGYISKQCDAAGPFGSSIPDSKGWQQSLRFSFPLQWSGKLIHHLLTYLEGATQTAIQYGANGVLQL